MTRGVKITHYLLKSTTRGYAVQGRNYFNHTPGKTSSIAVPIFKQGRFEAAMTLVFFASALKLENALESYLPEMLATARTIGEALDKAVAERVAA